MSAVSPHSHSWHWPGKRPWKQAVSSGSCSLPLGSRWAGEARHGLEETREERMCSAPGGSQAVSKTRGWTQRQLCLWHRLHFQLMPIHKWPCWLETRHCIQEGYHTQLLLPRDAGKVGAMALDHWSYPEMASGAGLLVHSPAQPTDTVTTFLQAFSCSHHPCLLAVQLCSLP